MNEDVFTWSESCMEFLCARRCRTGTLGLTDPQARSDPGNAGWWTLSGKFERVFPALRACLRSDLCNGCTAEEAPTLSLGRDHNGRAQRGNFAKRVSYLGWLGRNSARLAGVATLSENKSWVAILLGIIICAAQPGRTHISA